MPKITNDDIINNPNAKHFRNEDHLTDFTETKCFRFDHSILTEKPNKKLWVLNDSNDDKLWNFDHNLFSIKKIKYLDSYFLDTGQKNNYLILVFLNNKNIIKKQRIILYNSKML